MAETDPDGLLAIGGDLSVTRLLNAYRAGIFPWFSENQPLLWWSPDPRTLLFPDRLHVSRSLRKSLRRQTCHVTFDTAFEEVIRHCAVTPRTGQDGTWITNELLHAYCESMFSHRRDASKIALVKLVDKLAAAGFLFIDCQVVTDHLLSLGAETVDRTAFLRINRQAVGTAVRIDWKQTGETNPQ